MLVKRYFSSKRVVHRHALSMYLFPIKYESTEGQIFVRSCFFARLAVTSHFFRLSYMDLSTIMHDLFNP